MKIIQSKLKEHQEQTNWKEQAGVRTHQGYIDHTFTICQLVEERVRVITVFINFKFSFDCVYWLTMWWVLENEYVLLKMI